MSDNIVEHYGNFLTALFFKKRITFINGPPWRISYRNTLRYTKILYYTKITKDVKKEGSCMGKAINMNLKLAGANQYRQIWKSCPPSFVMFTFVFNYILFFLF